jgi:hypothetical protein
MQLLWNGSKKNRLWRWSICGSKTMQRVLTNFVTVLTWPNGLNRPHSKRGQRRLGSEQALALCQRAGFRGCRGLKCLTEWGRRWLVPNLNADFKQCFIFLIAILQTTLFPRTIQLPSNHTMLQDDIVCWRYKGPNLCITDEIRLC